MTSQNPPKDREHVPLASPPDTDTPGIAQYNKHNRNSRIKSLHNRITHAHDYRVQIWATMTDKINKMQQELVALGVDPVELYNPDFDDPTMLEQYKKVGKYTG